MPAPSREILAIEKSLRAVTSSLDIAEVLRAVLEGIKTFTAAEGLSLLLYDRERDELVFSATETLRDNTMVGGAPAPAAQRALGCGQGLVQEDGRVLAVALCRGGSPIGAIELRDSYDGRAFDAADRARLQEIADSLPVSVEVDRLARDSEALRRIFTTVAAAVPSRATTLLLRDPAGRTLAFSASRALEPGVIDGTRLGRGQGIAGWVARERKAVCLTDAAADPRHEPALDRRTGLVPRGMICVPVQKGDELLGVIQVINKLDGSAFDEAELQLVTVLADHAAMAIDNARLYREARTAAITDDLTGLGNSRRFGESLPAMLAGNGPVSLLVLDLDNFKEVVDRHGHLLGSRTIAFIGRLIGRFVRPGDLAARFGGDEFVVVLPATDTFTARQTAEAIRAAIAETRVLEGSDVDLSGVTSSVGVATYPDHAQDADALFRAADEAMYSVKRTTKNAVGIAS